MSKRIPEYMKGTDNTRIRHAWQLRFSLSEKQFKAFLTDDVCRQLSQCKNDEARRLILGVKP